MANRILFISGFGRSGSTLVSELLHLDEDFVNVGELRHFWKRVLRDNMLCGCGQAFTHCGFWSRIIDELRQRLGGNFDVEKMVALQEEVDAIARLPSVVWPRLRSQEFQVKHRRYCEILTQLIESISTVAPDKILVDASKTPMHGFLLHDTGFFEIRVLHFVRDARAVGYSWLRKKHRTEVHWQKTYMPQYSSLKTAIWWGGANIFSEILGNRVGSVLRLNYEDFCESPSETMSQIVRFAKDNPPEDMPPYPLRKSSCCSIGGNPSKYGTELDISLDREWETAMGRRDFWTITPLVLPLLQRYAYPLIPKATTE